MDIKKLLSQKKDIPADESEKRRMSRLNALEVQVKQLLQFEKQVRPLLLKLNRQGGEREDKEKRSTVAIPSEDMVGKKEYEQLLRKVNTLEGNLKKVYLNRGSHQEKQFNRNEQREEMDLSAIQTKIAALESHYLLLNEVQAVILKQMTDLSEKLAELSNPPSESEQPEPLFKTLYIDKLFLEKYEQNNNFAQLGIKELSGALNIGATYGKDVVPKEVTEQIQEDVAQMKAMKEQMYQKQSSGKETEMEDQENINEETDIEFTNIQIVDDSSTEES